MQRTRSIASTLTWVNMLVSGVALLLALAYLVLMEFLQP